MSHSVGGKRKRPSQSETDHIRSVIEHALSVIHHRQQTDNILRRVLDIDNIKSMLKIHTGKKRVTLDDLKIACKTRQHVKLIEGIVKEKAGDDLALAFRYAVLFPERPEDRMSVLSGVVFDDRPPGIGMGYQMLPRKSQRPAGGGKSSRKHGSHKQT